MYIANDKYRLAPLTKQYIDEVATLFTDQFLNEN